MIICQEIAFGSKEHRDSIRLRTDVLRKPLGLKFSEEELDGEFNQIHLGAFSENVLVGILLLKPINAYEIKMRQVAIREDLSGKGIGTMLVKYSERIALQKGCNIMRLHARLVAVPFYQKQSYTISGDEFLEVGIPHLEMQKSLI
jgi:predicted GNAT family N-acyltransferase